MKNLLGKATLSRYLRISDTCPKTWALRQMEAASTIGDRWPFNQGVKSWRIDLHSAKGRTFSFQATDMKFWYLTGAWFVKAAQELFTFALTLAWISEALEWAGNVNGIGRLHWQPKNMAGRGQLIKKIFHKAQNIPLAEEMQLNYISNCQLVAPKFSFVDRLPSSGENWRHTW